MSYHTLLRTLVEAQAQLGRAQATVWSAEEALRTCLPQVEVRTVHADANLWCTSRDYLFDVDGEDLIVGEFRDRYQRCGARGAWTREAQGSQKIIAAEDGEAAIRALMAFWTNARSPPPPQTPEIPMADVMPADPTPEPDVTISTPASTPEPNARYVVLVHAALRAAQRVSIPLPEDSHDPINDLLVILEYVSNVLQGKLRADVLLSYRHVTVAETANSRRHATVTRRRRAAARCVTSVVQAVLDLPTTPQQAASTARWALRSAMDAAASPQFERIDQCDDLEDLLGAV